MKIRRRYLPPGWYPLDAGETETDIRQMQALLPPKSAKEAVSVIAPHAGWAMSGRTALSVIRLFPSDLETVIVIGGHLRPGDGILAAVEDGYYTPQGDIPADLDLLENLEGELVVGVDIYPDNTVEVQLPLVRAFFPAAMALWLRVSPDHDAIRLGEVLARISLEMKRKVGLIGSTDLTHYGPGYGFVPQGVGAEARQWSRENDRVFIRSLLDMEPDVALKHASLHQSACSAGGAVAALSFALKRGVSKGLLVDYSTSYEVHPAPDFVGYAGIAYF